MTARMLGRRRPLDRPVLRLGSYLTGAVPDHPARADYLTGTTFGLYRNDEFGDCGPTDVANSRRQVTRWLTGTQTDPSQDDVFDLYKRSGNPTFDPNDPGGPGDGGVEMKTMLGQVVKGGIGGVKALAFAAVDVRNLDEVRAAIAIFGGLHLGVDLETAQQTQTDSGGPWDYRRSGEWGGHAVYAGGFTSQTGRAAADVSLVSWAQVLGTTDAFWTHQVEEAYIVIWPEHLGTRAFLEGVDAAALARDYEALTGRPFPGQPVPIPAPVPPGPAPRPDAADVGLAGAMKTWLTAKGLT